MAELHHECGIAAIYHLIRDEISPIAPGGDPQRVAGLIPRLLLDIQNRGQLAAGMTSYNPSKPIKTSAASTKSFALGARKKPKRS